MCSSSRYCSGVTPWARVACSLKRRKRRNWYRNRERVSNSFLPRGAFVMERLAFVLSVPAKIAYCFYIMP